MFIVKFTILDTECNVPIVKTLGVANLVMTASTETSGHGPSNIMLDDPYAADTSGGWIPSGTSSDEWLKVTHIYTHILTLLHSMDI
jgi:hypothetical protein